jgi:hypothetical protein
MIPGPAIVITVFLSAFLTASALALGPLNYKEISLLVRTGEKSEMIVAEAKKRKLLKGLTAEEEVALRGSGASAALLSALKDPGLLVSPAVTVSSEANVQKRPVSPERSAMVEPELPVKELILPAPGSNAKLLEEALVNARRPQVVTLALTSAFRLADLEKAKAKAQAEHKLLGFIMVWDQFFGHRTTTAGRGGVAGLAHFYRVFDSSMVLVFVRHEDELPRVPDAVKQGFFGPDEGGYAPNMAVVDASATEFIVEIPFGGANSNIATREALFLAGGDRMAAWLANHPTALARKASP